MSAADTIMRDALIGGLVAGLITTAGPGTTLVYALGGLLGGLILRLLIIFAHAFWTGFARRER